MKHKVEKAKGKNPYNFTDILQNIWNKLDPVMIRNFVKTIPLRMKACIDMHGDEIDLNVL